MSHALKVRLRNLSPKIPLHSRVEFQFKIVRFFHLLCILVILLLSSKEMSFIQSLCLERYPG